MSCPRIEATHIYTAIWNAIKFLPQSALGIINNRHFDRDEHDFMPLMSEAVRNDDGNVIEFLLKHRLADPTRAKGYLFFYFWDKKQYPLAKLIRKYILETGNKHIIDLVNTAIIENGIGTMLAGKKKSKGVHVTYVAKYIKYWEPLQFDCSSKFFEPLSYVPVPLPSAAQTILSIRSIDMAAYFPDH